MKNVLFILVAALLGEACVKKQSENNDGLLGLDYYPLVLGKYIVYNVDSTVYTLLPKDTVHYKYQIKEKISDSFTDNIGRISYRIERYIKPYNAQLSYDKQAWIIKEVWMMNADKKNIQVVESNIRYTKLAFPIQEKLSWNGNAYNNQGEWNYNYDYIDKTETINSSKFDKVLMVKQKEYRTAISYQYYIEKYAKGIGLVHREISDLLSQTTSLGGLVESRIGSGFTFKQTIVAYGYE